MAVRAGDLALRDLVGKVGDGCRAPEHLCDPPILVPQMVEVETFKTPISAVSAAALGEQLVDVADLRCLPREQFWQSLAPLRIRAQPIGASSGPDAMAVCTDHLTLRDFAVDEICVRALQDERRDAPLLLPDVVELENRWVSFAAVEARM